MNKNIAKIEDWDANSLFSNSSNISGNNDSRFVIDKHGKILERKKKGRLYSLGGGNERVRNHMARLDRLKTVGTFDLCMEVTAITKLACGFDERTLSQHEPTNENIIVECTINPSKSILKIGSDDTSIISVDCKLPSSKHISSLSISSLGLEDCKNRFKPIRKSKSFIEIVPQIGCKSSLQKHEVSYDRSLSSSCFTGKANFTKDTQVRAISCENLTIEFSSNKNLDKTSQIFEVKTTVENVNCNLRRRTLKKCYRIVRTDSEMFHEQILVSEASQKNSKSSTRESSLEENEKKGASVIEDVSSSTVQQSENVQNIPCAPNYKNLSIDTVFSDNVDVVDLDMLENEYKEHVKSSLLREYKSDGDGLDEVGKKRHEFGKWKNQSIDDFNFLAKDLLDEDSKTLRKDVENRTKSEGDKDVFDEFEMEEQRDSFDTQESTEDDLSERAQKRRQVGSNDQIEVISSENFECKSSGESLFEKRFGKFKKINKLLKGKRFSTSALYDKKKNDVQLSQSSQKDIIDNLSSPKSLKSKKFQFRKRKFSFFGKSQSNNDLNLKSIASKISLLSKSNFDISSKNTVSSNKLNAAGITGKYANEYRSDIITKESVSSTSPLSEAFFNSTGSYQLSAMELFEKFCSQDFTGLYKNEDEVGIELIEPNLPYTGYQDPSSKGAIKKCSLRKATLLKQNSEPKFYMKNMHDDFSFKNSQQIYNEEEENDDLAEFEMLDENFYTSEEQQHMSRRKLSFSQFGETYEGNGNDDEDYYEDQVELGNYDVNPVIENSEIDEIYLMQDKVKPFYGEFNEADEYQQESSIGDLLSVASAPPRTFSSHSLIDGISTSNNSSPIKREDDSLLKNIISDYVKNALTSETRFTNDIDQTLTRTKSVELLSDSSGTIKTYSNSEYAFDTIRHFNLDSCSTSKLSLSLKSDIFDELTLALPTDKAINICELDDFTLTPDISISENCLDTHNCQNEQDKIKNELQSQYTIIDFDEELESQNFEKYNQEKSTFADALNKQFDQLFSRSGHHSSFEENFDENVSTRTLSTHNTFLDSDTDATTPSIATVITAIKIPTRFSMNKLDPYSSGSNDDDKGLPSNQIKECKPISECMSQSTDCADIKKSTPKSKRSRSLGNLPKRKSNKCTPL